MKFEFEDRAAVVFDAAVEYDLDQCRFSAVVKKRAVHDHEPLVVEVEALLLFLVLFEVQAFIDLDLQGRGFGSRQDFAQFRLPVCRRGVLRYFGAVF